MLDKSLPFSVVPEQVQYHGQSFVENANNSDIEERGKGMT
jgi:hypothetical protein